MYCGPTILTIILKAGNTATEERGRFPPTLYTSAFITHLSIENVWLYLNLKIEEEKQ